MKDTPAPADLPLRALVGWACKYHFSYEPTAPEVCGALRKMDLIEEPDENMMRIVGDTLEARR